MRLDSGPALIERKSSTLLGSNNISLFGSVGNFEIADADPVANRTVIA